MFFANHVPVFFVGCIQLTLPCRAVPLLCPLVLSSCWTHGVYPSIHSSFCPALSIFLSFPTLFLVSRRLRVRLQRRRTFESLRAKEMAPSRAAYYAMISGLRRQEDWKGIRAVS